MSEERALRFLQAVREDSDLHELIVREQDNLTLEDLVEIGAGAGWYFGVDDLCRAFRHEWTMRWMSFRFGKQHPADSERDG